MNKNLDIFAYLEELKQKVDKSKVLKVDIGKCDLELTLLSDEEKRNMPSRTLPRIDANYCRLLKNSVDKV
jgi:hypothetical protein